MVHGGLTLTIYQRLLEIQKVIFFISSLKSVALHSKKQIHTYSFIVKLKRMLNFEENSYQLIKEQSSFAFNMNKLWNPLIYKRSARINKV